MIISNMFEEMSYMISRRVVFIRKGRDYTYFSYNNLEFDPIAQLRIQKLIN